MAVIKIMVSGNDKLKTALIQALKKQPGIMIVEEDADLSKIVSRNDVPNVSVIRKIAEDFRVCVFVLNPIMENIANRLRIFGSFQYPRSV